MDQDGPQTTLKAALIINTRGSAVVFLKNISGAREHVKPHPCRIAGSQDRQEPKSLVIGFIMDDQGNQQRNRPARKSGSPAGKKAVMPL